MKTMILLAMLSFNAQALDMVFCQGGNLLNGGVTENDIIFKYVILGIVAVAMFVCTYLYDPHKEEKLAAEERKKRYYKIRF